MKYSLKNSPKTAFFRSKGGQIFFAGLPPAPLFERHPRQPVKHADPQGQILPSSTVLQYL
jgi:hypothetical protein